MPQTPGETTISDESRGGLEGRRDKVIKDKHGSKKQKEGPARTFKQKRQTTKVERAGGYCEEVRRARVDDAARASRAAPKGSKHVRAMAIRVLGFSPFA